MNKYRINYYLDKSDQIEVDGHTLSRLYLSPKQSFSFRDIASSKLAIFGHPSIRRMNKMLLTVGAIALIVTAGCRFALYMYAPDIVMLDGLRK